MKNKSTQVTACEVKKLRDQLCLTQKDFGNLLCVEPTGRTVRRWENKEIEVPGPIQLLVTLLNNCPEVIQFLGLVKKE